MFCTKVAKSSAPKQVKYLAASNRGKIDANKIIPEQTASKTDQGLFANNILSIRKD